jgi:hypothetical protein
MWRISRVLEIHTNNLFVERAAEPESYDHRVLEVGDQSASST